MKLLSCPFCAGDNLSVEIRASAWNEQEEEAHVICNDCACMSPVYIWNRRVSVKPNRINSIRA